jgi:hypothetical protein
MLEPVSNPPLVRWDGVHLVLSLDLLEDHLRRRTAATEGIADLSLAGEGELIELSARLVWRKLRAPVRVELGEIRLKRRVLGFRLGRLRTAAGMPVPLAVVERLLHGLAPGAVTVLRTSRIVVVDLRRSLPPELDLSLLTVQVVGRQLHLWLGPGTLGDLPIAARPALPPVRRS